MKKTVVMMIGVFLLISLLYAQEEKPFKLGEIVVTATRRPIALKDVPASVTVINKEEIKASPVSTVDDLLESIVGVDTLESELTEKTKRSVRLRGVPDQGKVLVLVDGVPLNWPVHGDVEWGEIPLESIERIEVVRGPFSSLYGSHAMGGVINITTRVPEKGFEGEVIKRYGSYDTSSWMANIGGLNDSFGYYLNYKFMETEGYYSMPKPWDAPEFVTRNKRKTETLGGRLYWFPDSDSSLKLGTFHCEKDRNRGYKYDNSYRKTTGSYLTFQREGGNGWDWLSTIYHHSYEYTTEFDDKRKHNRIDHIEDKDSSHWGIILQLSRPLTSWSTLTGGFEYKHNEFELEDEYLHKIREIENGGRQDYWSLYLQNEMSFLDDKFLVTLGAREDWWRSYGGRGKDTNPAVPGVAPYDDEYPSQSYDSLNPKIAFVYHLTPETTLRSSVGKGFQAPNVFRMYRTMQRRDKLTLPNPDLKAETLISYEVGVDHWFTNTLLARLTFYDSYGDNFISSRQIAPKTYLVDNVTKVRMWGIETELKYRVTEHLSCFANHTYSIAKIERNNPEPALEGNYLKHSPRNKFNLGITYDNPSLFTVTALWRYVGEMYDDNENTEKLDDYETLGVKLQRKIGDHFELSLGCENVFGERYEIPDHGVQLAPGQFWTFSVTYKF